MDLDDEAKRPGTQGESEDKPRAKSPAEDLLADVEFDLIDDPDDQADEDVFARDTAIPQFDPEAVALESMRRPDGLRKGGAAPPKLGEPARAKPPPVRRKRLTPVTLEPPSAELEFDSFDAPIDVFSDRPRGNRGQSERPLFAPSEIPTAPPLGDKTLLEDSKPSTPVPRRANRAAFLAETSRNRVSDFGFDANFDNPPKPNGSTQHRASPTKDADHALRFVQSHDPLLDSLAPMAGLEPPPPPSGTPEGAGAAALQEAYAVGDYTRALAIAEDMLARSPDDLSTRRYAQNCRDVLTQMFAARIGPLDQVISVVVSPEEVQWLSLDHRAGFLLSLVDGQSTVDEILDISGMTRLDALRIIVDLTKQQVVRVA